MNHSFITWPRLVGAGIAILAAVILGYVLLSPGGETPPPEEPTATVTSAIAVHGSLAPTALAYGMVTASPGHTQIIVMPHDGEINNVAVHDGDVVHADQPIVTVAIAPAAAAQFSQARTALDFAKQDLSRVERLYAEKLATNDQLATARKAVADGQSQLDQLVKIGADRAEDVLRAPFDGVVTGLSVAVGDRPQVGAALATVASRVDVVVQLGLEPGDAAMLMPGAHVRLTLPQGNEANVTGRLASVGAAIDPTSRLVKAVVNVSMPPEMRLALGTTVVAQIDLPARQGILVPRSVLLEDAEGPYVFTVVAGKAHRQAVRIAVETDNQALLSEGVAAGARVIASGNAALEDGVAVQEAKP